MTNEEAIEVLKCCITDDCENCHMKVENAYICAESSFAPTFVEVPKDVLLQVLELPKEWEARVMTLEEVLSRSWDYCYIEAEVRPHSKMRETLCGTHRLYCTTSIVLEWQIRGNKEYGKTWRCWTARPTDEQREAVKWDE